MYLEQVTWIFVLFYVIRRNIIIIFMINIIIFLLWKNVWFFVYISICCVGTGISTLMSISDEVGSHLFRRKMEKT